MEKLFVICPFSQLEQRLKVKYGDNPYFITVPGGYILNNLESIQVAIVQNKINELILVTDLNCSFVESIICRKKLHGLSYEKHLENIYIENFYNYFINNKIESQKYNLLKLNLIFQLSEIEKNDFFIENKIKIKGLIYNHANYLFETIEKSSNLIKK
jgi:carbonic anhydrase